MKDIEKKRKKEEHMVSDMVHLYCQKKHHTRRGCLCSECGALLDYAIARSEHCPFMETKTFCSNCQVHCYRPDRREQIRQVMRFAGPRMIFHHPVAAIHHLVATRIEKNRLKRKETKG